jgi:hypothetical protein
MRVVKKEQQEILVWQHFGKDDSQIEEWSPDLAFAGDLRHSLMVQRFFLGECIVLGSSNGDAYVCHNPLGDVVVVTFPWLP